MITSEQLKEIQNRAAELGRYLDIDKKKIELEEAQLHTQAPDFWEDPKKAEKQMKTVKELERWVNGYKEVCTDVDELSLAVDFHKELKRRKKNRKKNGKRKIADLANRDLVDEEVN